MPPGERRGVGVFFERLVCEGMLRGCVDDSSPDEGSSYSARDKGSRHLPYPLFPQGYYFPLFSHFLKRVGDGRSRIHARPKVLMGCVSRMD